jgi:hypothetical protein
MKGIFSQIASSGGSPSSANTTTSQLGAAATFTGGFELNNSPDVMVVCQTDQAGKLYFDFSVDGINFSSFPPNGFDVAAGINEVHNAVKGPRYFRVRFTNTSVNPQTYLRIYTYYGSFRQLNAPLNSTVSSDADSIITRSVLMGQTDGGHWNFVPVTQEGHLEVAIHDPILPFGAVHVENMTPIFQSDAVYGLNSGQVLTNTSGSGTVTADDSLFEASTGATIFSQGVLLGRKRLRYRPGQGVVARFTGIFTTPVINSYQLVGVGHAEDGVYVGYGDTNDLTNTEFGVLYVKRGVREIKTLTVTTGATSAGNVTITLNGTIFTVAVTNSSNIQRTVYEISQGAYTGWDAFPIGATVVFLRKSSGASAGTQAFGAGSTGSAATIVQTKAGVASIDTFYPQSDWNGDKLDGTGSSAVIIDTTKLNIFQIGIGYLGTDSIVCKCKVTPTDGNNSTWVVFHTIRLTNQSTSTNFGNPSFPFTMAAYSAGSTTNLTVGTSSFAGFIEGQKILQGNRFSYFNALTTVTAGAFQALFTIVNKRVYNGRSNQAVINLLSVTGAVKHTQPVIFYLIRGGTLLGNPNFIDLSSNSCSAWDTSATTVTYSTGDQLLWTGHLGETGEIDHHFGNGSFNAEELTLQPGEWVTLAAKSVQNNVAYCTGAINTREDQ